MLKSIQIENYKCFSQSEKILFWPSMNIVIGKNNSGKTALLSLLNYEFPSAKPFRGPNKALGIPLNSHSKITFELEITGKEIERAALSTQQ